MKKEMTPEEKILFINSTKNRFFIMVHIAGLMIMMTAFNPFFWANALPAIVMMVLSLVVDKWAGATKLHCRIIFILILLSCLWLGANTTQQWFMPPVPTGPTSIPVFTTPEIIWTMGWVGHLIALVGNFEFLNAIKLMD